MLTVSAVCVEVLPLRLVDRWLPAAMLPVLLAAAQAVCAQVTVEPKPRVTPPVDMAPDDAPATVAVGEGIRVAMVDSGVDYTLPLINNSLARYPEEPESGAAGGRIVGIDFRDLDNRPWDIRRTRAGVRRHGTRVASVLLAEAPGVELVPYRFPGQDMRLMHALVEHAAANDVRIIGLPLGSDNPEQWAALEQAARTHTDILFVASAGNDGRNLDQQPLYPASLPLDNLVVVTSADDFGRPSPESGVGRATVDYLVPAEAVPVVDFGGKPDIAAGSSYAVPRVAALFARMLQDDRELNARDLIARVARTHANGLMRRYVSQGVIIDPLQDQVADLGAVEAGDADLLRDALYLKTVSDSLETARTTPLTDLSIDIYILDDQWDTERVSRSLADAASILNTCGITLDARHVLRPDLAAHPRLRDLHIGAAHTVFTRLKRGGPDRLPTLVFARDTRMQTPFDGEAFGRGNTRHRPWMTDTVWLTLAIRDEGIALAHELFHVLANDGSHVDLPGNLMLARTTGDNRTLTKAQCEQVVSGH